MSLEANRMDVIFICLDVNKTKYVRISQQAIPHANEIGTYRTATTSETRFDRAATTTTTTNTATSTSTTYAAYCVMG